MRHRAKFCGNRSNRCGDMTISFFQYGGRPPSWICSARVWTTHERHLVVFMTVQNLFGINAVVSIICKLVRVFYELGLKTPIQAPKMRVFSDLNP